MKSIIEDFDHIASRLNQIEQEKHTAIMATNVEEVPQEVTYTYMGTTIYRPVPAHSIEDVYCWPAFQFSSIDLELLEKREFSIGLTPA